MGNVVLGTTMSLDGFINEKNGAMNRLYPNLEELRNTEMLQEAIRNTGAVIMGRQSYNLANGDFTDYEFQVPIFVLTHNPPVMVTKGQNEQLTITFVNDTIEKVIEQAKAAAGDKEVTIIGSANIAQQCLKAGVVDVLELGLVPVLLGEGLRFFEYLGIEPIELEKIKLWESPGRTDIRFRIIK